MRRQSFSFAFCLDKQVQVGIGKNTSAMLIPTNTILCIHAAFSVMGYRKQRLTSRKNAERKRLHSGILKSLNGRPSKTQARQDSVKHSSRYLSQYSYMYFL